MSKLQHRQSIIQEKRKKTPWRDFVMEICSRFPVNLYKNKGLISKYPDTDRIGKLIVSKEREKYSMYSEDYNGNFLHGLKSIFVNSYIDNIDFYGNNENCDFAEAVYGAKNGYLSFSFGDNAENVMYSCFVRTNVSNVYNSFYVEKESTNIYSSYFIQTSFNIFFSKYITTSNNIYFSTNLTGCSECILCDDLENKTYCIKNIQYSKDEYRELKKEFLKNKSQFYGMYGNLNGAKNKNTVNCSGTGIYQCNNIENGNLVRNMNDSRNIICGTGGYTGSSNIYDGLDVGLDTHHMYGTGMAGTNSEHLYCCSGITRCMNLFYCYHLENCSFCLGCIGLKNKSYCILNKQYTKEERYTKVDEIFGQMHEDGTLGDFFPATMNPFYFNDTAAYLIGSSPAGTTTKGGGQTFTKEEVMAKGYLRRDEPIKVDIPAGVQTVSVKDLDKYEGRTVGTHGNASKQKRTIDDEILKKVIIDEQGNAYRIIPMELEFLRKYELPLPRKHWLDRMKENFRIS